MQWHDVLFIDKLAKRHRAITVVSIEKIVLSVSVDKQ